MQFNFQPGSQISANALQRLAAEVMRQGKITAQYPLEASDSGAGINLRLVEREFYAIVTDVDGLAHAWQEIQPVGDGTWSIYDEGRVGTLDENPAYESNGNAVAVDTVVYLRPGSFTEYVFDGSGEAVTIPIGCGLGWLDSVLVVNPEEIAGPGLTPVGEYSCAVQVNTSCGLTLTEGGEVAVNPSDLAGAGLVTGTGCTLDVNAGCGLVINEETNTVEVYPDDIAGLGLTPAGDYTCAVDIQTGCGLEVNEENELVVNADDLAGNALSVGPDCKLNVVPGCGITLAGGTAVTVDNSALAQEGLTTSGTCGLRIDPDGVSGPAFSAVTSISILDGVFTINVTPFSFLVNPGGAFVGFEPGDTFDYALRNCCPVIWRIHLGGSDVIVEGESSSGQPNEPCTDFETLCGHFENVGEGCECLVDATFTVAPTGSPFSWEGGINDMDCIKQTGMDFNMHCVDGVYSITGIASEVLDPPIPATTVVASPLRIVWADLDLSAYLSSLCDGVVDLVIDQCLCDCATYEDQILTLTINDDLCCTCNTVASCAADTTVGLNWNSEFNWWMGQVESTGDYNIAFFLTCEDGVYALRVRFFSPSICDYECVLQSSVCDPLNLVFALEQEACDPCTFTIVLAAT